MRNHVRIIKHIKSKNSFKNSLVFEIPNQILKIPILNSNIIKCVFEKADRIYQINIRNLLTILKKSFGYPGGLRPQDPRYRYLFIIQIATCFEIICHYLCYFQLPCVSITKYYFENLNVIFDKMETRTFGPNTESYISANNLKIFT